MSILSIRNVTKRYDKHVAVNNLTFDVPKDKIFGLLGPNGAGKTSLIRIITTITAADEGEILLDGDPINSNTPSQIGYMPEERGLYKKMKVGDHLLYLAQLKGMSKAEANENIKYWFDKFDIKSWWNKEIDELSKGMQQKIQFIATVLHKPKLLILDEPFSGLDPINANLIKDEIYNLHKEGISIIFSTHRMEQVEEICEEIILMNNGQKVLQGDVAHIKEQHKNHQYEIVCTNDELPYDFQQQFQLIQQEDKKIIIQVSPSENSNDLLNRLIQSGLKIRSFKEVLPSINEIFIQKVGESQSSITNI